MQILQEKISAHVSSAATSCYRSLINQQPIPSENYSLNSYYFLSILKYKEKNSVAKDYFIFPLTQPSPFGEGFRTMIFYL